MCGSANIDGNADAKPERAKEKNYARDDNCAGLPETNMG